MTDDTISRQAAIEAIEDLEWYHQNKNKDMVLGANSDEHQAWYKADDIYKTLDILPSAQPEVEKRGKWYWNHNNGYYYCSECDAISPREDQYGNYIDCPNFCPNCGSDMRGET